MNIMRPVGVGSRVLLVLAMLIAATSRSEAQLVDPYNPNVCTLIAAQQKIVGGDPSKFSGYQTLAHLQMGCAEARGVVSKGNGIGTCDLFSAAGDSFAVAAKLKQTSKYPGSQSFLDSLSTSERAKRLNGWARIALGDYYAATDAYTSAEFACGWETSRGKSASSHSEDMYSAINDLERG